MVRLPVLSGAEAVKVFERAGWTVDRHGGHRAAEPAVPK
jgi:predicted RNA binding protein YcfA (HicA-like mRNA interferase family)